MNFKPGDKVWVITLFALPGDLPVGTSAGVIIEPSPIGVGGWRLVIEGYPAWDTWCAHQNCLRPRHDPPPQQEPKREATGSWDHCVWKPATTREESRLRFARRNFEEVVGQSPHFDWQGFTWSIS